MFPTAPLEAAILRVKADATGAADVITNPDQITGDNSYHVVPVQGGSADVVIDGFTITGGGTGKPPVAVRTCGVARGFMRRSSVR